MTYTTMKDYQFGEAQNQEECQIKVQLPERI